jgi:hypothetical protein
VSYSDADDEEGPSAKDIAGDETAKELGAKAEKMAQLQKFMKKIKMKCRGGDNKIVNKEK